jgi:hypothetical protein
MKKEINRPLSMTCLLVIIFWAAVATFLLKKCDEQQQVNSQNGKTVNMR